MQSKKIGEQSVLFSAPIYLEGSGSVVGSIEGRGPLRDYFDYVAEDALFGQDSFEKAEKKFFTEAVKKAVEDAKLSLKDVDYLIGGDLLNQIISASYSARDLDLPFLGIYGACSSMSQSLVVGAMLLDGGFGKNIVCAASSHFATAERQFRFPLELGTPKPPTGQDTVTGAGASVLTLEPRKKDSPVIAGATVGKVVDFGVKDANNMGAAMAPAAVQTILTHLEDMEVQPEYYDMIVTGDLGIFGSELLVDLANRAGVDLSRVHRDCGKLIYEGMEDMHCGASGCGCSAVVLNGFLQKKLRAATVKRILFVATGALMSPTSVQQGESIAGVAHAVAIERRETSCN